MPTVSKSFHDDYIKTNAKLRNDLGLKPILQRFGTGCCAWCAAVAGKWRFGEQPDEVFHRHDNCACTVTYENGRERQDVWSKRTWNDTDPEEVERLAPKPAVNSEERAREIEERGLRGLTLAGKRDIINSDLGEFKQRLRSDPNMTSEYYNAIKDKFSHGADTAKAAFSRYVPTVSVENAAYAGGAYYDPTTGKINMSYAKDLYNPRGVGATWFHEHGHLIDDAAGGLSSDKAFYDALFKDKRDYTTATRHLYGTKDINEAYRAISDELQDIRLHSAVSDIFNGLSVGKIRGCGYHDQGYWTDEKVCQEAFAHMYEAQFDRARYEQMKHYFPTALARFEELLGGAVK